jgi:hypothetical protein
MNFRSELWDFDENKNFIQIGEFKVLNIPNSSLNAAKLLYKIRNLIFKCFKSILENVMITPEIELLINTPFLLQEMQLVKDQKLIKFEGLNKPKKVHLTNEIEIGPDKQLRAEYRIIFLNLRKNGKLQTINSLKKLIAHELTHTALNHVLWRDDDHGPEFKLMNKIILENLN